MGYQTKVQKVEAFQWNGEKKEELPKWLQLKADTVDNSRHLWINNAVGESARRGDWIVGYDDQTIEVYSESEFNRQFEEAK